MVLAAVIALVDSLPAQAELRARLERLEQRLAEVQQTCAELEGLSQRHADGEDVSDSRWLTVTEVDVARANATGEAGAVVAEDRTSRLRSELARLDAEVVAARLRARERAIGDSLPRPEELARLAERARDAVAPQRPVPAPVRDGPVRICGSVDHVRVGCALLDAGVDLSREAERLEREGRADAAASRRMRARESFEAARAELEQAIAGDLRKAPLLAVFALARSEEKLGRIGAADTLYAAVMDRDRRIDRSGQPVYGPFGRSARTARAVIEWLQDTADWQPRRDVDQIRWDDR